MFTVMKDPVLLPSSKTIIDRATIKSHLLSDPKDPFNRAPLTVDQVVPCEWCFVSQKNIGLFKYPVPELKARIEEFLLERRRQRQDAMVADST